MYTGAALIAGSKVGFVSQIRSSDSCHRRPH
jgi:hypothetical protein